MTIQTFLRQCADLWPGKELGIRQEEYYHAKLGQFSESEVGKIFDWLSENSKYFPKIADVFEAARHCGYLDRVKSFQPHAWDSSECRLCGGSGRLAVFFEQLFDPNTGQVQRELRRVMQYEASAATNRLNQDWTRFLFRCNCEAGSAKTLESGIPRWNAA